MNVVLAGGGTAGHIEPALALAEALRRRNPDIRISAIGTARGLETRLVPERGVELDLIPPVPLPRRLTLDLVKVPARLRRAVRDARAILARREADAVVGFGGYVALPAYLAARKRVPVVVHEANARAGLANRIGARFAAAVATSYPDTPLRNAVRTGIPLRSSIATLDRAAQRAEALASFGLQELPTLLVFGGSQGARRINESVAAAAAALTGAGVQVLHATGAAHADSVRAALAEQGVAGGGSHAPYVVVPYLDRMDLAYSAADLALCRAGAMTCAELAAVGLPAVFVPLPHGNGEQALNAAEVVAAGGALRVDDADLTADWVRANVASLAADRSRLAGMAQKAAGFGRRDAADALAAIVERIAAQR